MNQEQIAGVLTGRLFANRELHEKQAHEIAAVLAPLITAAQAEAFEQGQKSGMRHADRLIAADGIGRPDLPGPISRNPYRTELALLEAVADTEGRALVQAIHDRKAQG